MTAPSLDLPTLLGQRLQLPPEQVAALLDGGDPQQLMLLALLGQAREPQPATDPEREGADDARSSQVVRHLLMRQQRALLAADRMALYIARALGACPQCWGLDQRCASCAGKGGPGSSQPDADRLLGLVRPALLRLGLEVTSAPANQPAT